MGPDPAHRRCRLPTYLDHRISHRLFHHSADQYHLVVNHEWRTATAISICEAHAPLAVCDIAGLRMDRDIPPT